MSPRRTSYRNFRGSVGGRCRRPFLREQRYSMSRRRFLTPLLDGERGMGKGEKMQVPGDFKLAVKLRRGPKGNAETTNELKRRAEGVSFNHIGGYRYRCSTDLVGEAKVTTEGLSEGEPVGGTRQRIRALPGLKGRKLLHGANMVVYPHSRRIVFVQAGAKKRISVIPFPFPLFPFPGV